MEALLQWMKNTEMKLEIFEVGRAEDLLQGRV